MITDINAPLKDLEDSELAYKRVEPDALALRDTEFTALNVDVVAATSIILGAAPRVLAYRDRMAKLAEFDVRHVDNLVNRAKAAWYAAITNLPDAEPRDFQEQFDECVTLRTHLLTWALPLVHARLFEQTAIDKIKEGSGNKDVPSDVVALVALYRSKWDAIKNMCGVTEAELARGAQIAPGVFATVSRRENKALPSQSDGTLRVRRFWTLVDRGYDQCQRGIAFLEWGTGDLSVIAPSARRNAGPATRAAAAGPDAPPVEPAPAPLPAPPAPTTAALPAGPPVGSGSPFAR